MKKLFVMLVLALVSVSFAANVAPTKTQSKLPANVGPAVDLHTTTAASADTFDAAEIQTYGPYQIASTSESPMFKGFMIQGDIITGTTPTMEFSYQLTSGLTISDTLSKWTPVCTLQATAQQTYVDLSSLVGKAVVFRVNNYDGTACQIPNKLRVMFKEDYTYNRNR
jgi:hypothetical protein